MRLISFPIATRSNHTSRKSSSPATHRHLAGTSARGSASGRERCICGPTPGKLCTVNGIAGDRRLTDVAVGAPTWLAFCLAHALSTQKLGEVEVENGASHWASPICPTWPLEVPHLPLIELLAPPIEVLAPVLYHIICPTGTGAYQCAVRLVRL